jgi:hypothetical protein
MKKITEFFIVALLAGMYSWGCAQEPIDFRKGPKPTEIVIGKISQTYRLSGETRFSDPELYNKLMELAKKEYPNHQYIDIRNAKDDFRVDFNQGYWDGKEWRNSYRRCYLDVTAIIVEPDFQTLIRPQLSKTMDKALRNVREGSRVAIDMATISGDVEINRDDFKDQIIDVLLDKGYRVVAKDYLEKLYDEIKDQESGIYNDGTTVKPDNFSAVGYYINVKVTETSLRVQVVNVSTGEYEGNATVNF